MARQPTFIDDKEREYFSRAQVGEQVRSFLNSEVGRYLHGCAKLALEEVRNELEQLDPDSIWQRLFYRRKLRRLQLEAKAARYFMQWCAEAIQDGDYAYRQLETYREGTDQ